MGVKRGEFVVMLRHWRPKTLLCVSSLASHIWRRRKNVKSIGLSRLKLKIGRPKRREFNATQRNDRRSAKNCMKIAEQWPRWSANSKDGLKRFSTLKLRWWWWSSVETRLRWEIAHINLQNENVVPVVHWDWAERKKNGIDSSEDLHVDDDENEPAWTKAELWGLLCLVWLAYFTKNHNQPVDRADGLSQRPPTRVQQGSHTLGTKNKSTNSCVVLFTYLTSWFAAYASSHGPHAARESTLFMFIFSFFFAAFTFVIRCLSTQHRESSAFEYEKNRASSDQSQPATVNESEKVLHFIFSSSLALLFMLLLQKEFQE